MAQGWVKQRLTNLTTGKFIDVTSSGPIFLDYHADGSLTEPTGVGSSSVRRAVYS